MKSIIFFVGLMLLFVIYFFPTFIAIHKIHPKKLPYIFINTITGLTSVGLIVVLASCFLPPPESNNSTREKETDIDGNFSVMVVEKVNGTK